MRTPAGKECRYFYGNYFRGRSQEECRLLDSASPTLPWNRDLCTTCPVPGILADNACENMALQPTLERPFPFIKKQVRVQAYCLKAQKKGFDPHVGCGECHPLPIVFKEDHK